MEGFKPASKFDHDEADFKLEGQHKAVDCKECHAVTEKNGKGFQNFTDVDFMDCKSCHNDVHGKQIQGDCKTCHTATSFSDFIGLGSFDHDITGFPLIGSHNKIDCFACHARSEDPLDLFQDNLGVKSSECAKCHIDAHEGRYGNECAKCHKESSFLSLKDLNFFDHGITDYPLLGNHRGVDCKKCHAKRFSTPIDFAACKNCHEDYHKEEFSSNGLSPDCVQCHSLEEGFGYSLYTLEDHNRTKFPLQGAHTATPCFACHVSEKLNRWTFVNMGSKCADCHIDIHQDHISSAYYPDNNCTVCHVDASWASVKFDHDLTNWPLSGRHKKVDCRDCHMSASNDKIQAQHFAGLDKQCFSCHDNVHDDLFAVDGVTDCKRCHVTDSWFPEKFDHNNTAFPLTGKHTDVACSRCHEVASNDGSYQTVYKLGKIECVDCHK